MENIPDGTCEATRCISSHLSLSSLPIRGYDKIDWRLIILTNKGDNQLTPTIVDKKTQEQALKEMLKAIHPEVLALPKHVLELIPARNASNQKLFKEIQGQP